MSLNRFNPAVGRYSVEADMGPSYATQRQEAFEAFTQILTTRPEAWSAMATGLRPLDDQFAAAMMFGSGERFLPVHDPVDVAQRRNVGVECRTICEPDVIAEKLQATGVMRRDQHLQEQPPEQRRKNLDAQKVVRSAGDPA